MEIQKNENICNFNLQENELTIYKIEEIYSLINKELNSCQKLELNLENITECDTSGIQLLLALKKYAKESEKVININFNSKVEELIALYNLKSNFE